MKLNLLFSVIILIIFVQCRTQKDTAKILLETKNKFVPDLREGVFSIKAKERNSKIILTGETDSKEAHNALLEEFKKAGYAIEDSIVVLPSNTSSSWALVTLSTANLRIAPSHDAEMVTQALMGTPVKLLKENDDWTLVQTPDKYVAWCENDAYAVKNESSLLEWRNSKRMIVTSWFDFVHDTLTGKSVSDVVAGCILQFVAEKKDSLIVSLPDGRKGFIAKTCVSDFGEWKKQKQPNTDKLIETARSFMGIPYLWGGNSIKGSDCSGFVKSVYFLNGYILARDASQQALYGTNVILDNNHRNLLPGDLLFFGRPAKDGKNAHITHVGMYLGDSEFIHSSGRVKINSFDSTRANYSRYRTISLLQSRRIFGSQDTTRIKLIKNHPWY